MSRRFDWDFVKIFGWFAAFILMMIGIALVDSDFGFWILTIWVWGGFAGIIGYRWGRFSGRLDQQYEAHAAQSGSSDFAYEADVRKPELLSQAINYLGISFIPMIALQQIWYVLR